MGRGDEARAARRATMAARWTAALAGMLLLALAAGSAEAADRVALVIGQRAYQATPERPRALEDARIMAEALREAGFDVVERYDLSGQALHDAVIAFGAAAREAEIAAAYFSGHAFHLEGVDYLVATSADPGAADTAALLPLDGLRAAALRAKTLGLTLIESEGAAAAAWEGAQETRELAPLEREIVALSNGAGEPAPPEGPALFTGAVSAALKAQPDADVRELLRGAADAARAQRGAAGGAPIVAVGALDAEILALGSELAIAAAEAGEAGGGGAPESSAEDRPAAPPSATGAAAAPQEQPADGAAVVVDASGGGDYVSLHIAIEEAPEGATLTLRPGLYQGGITVAKRLFLRGDGPREEIVIEARDADTLRWSASGGALENLTLRQKSGLEGDAESPWGALDILEGALTVSDCDLSSVSGAIVHVRDGAKATLTRNQIHGGPRSGVFIYRLGEATLTANEVFDNKGAGVALGRERGPVQVIQNTLRDNAGSGISVVGAGGGEIVKNEIFSNAESGVYAKEGAYPRVVENVIRDNRGSGVEVQDKGHAEIKGNEIVRNHYANIEIGEGARVRIEGNVIRDGKQGGVFLHEAARGDVVKNEIFGNTLAAIEVGGGAVAMIEENVMRDGAASAVFAHTKAMAVVASNEITGNAGVGVRIEEGASAIVRGNQITSNKGAGVYLNAGFGDIAENQITDNKDAGLEAAKGATPLLTRNQITRNGYVGVWLYDGAGARAVENDLSANAGAATRVEPSAGEFVDLNNIKE